MLEVDQALALVLEQAASLPAHRVPLELALGSVLAQTVASDVDSPPHDKSIVDGYAILAADLARGDAELEVLEEITAGATPTRAVAAGTTSRIMTGAPLPGGADAVVMVERSELLPSTSGGSQRVRLRDAPPKTGQNIAFRGSSIRVGDSVLPAGRTIRPAEIGLLAEVGCTSPLVISRPRAAIVATGNELVPAGERPGPGQIRNSNGPMLQALVQSAGGEVIGASVGRDDPASLGSLFRAGFLADVLLIAGGVSAGVLDLAPGVLRELGVAQVFHKVRLKPGQPLWFGVNRSGDRQTLVFGLPGNPVSALVCFELFVRPAMIRLRGLPSSSPQPRPARLASPFTQRGTRPMYFPADLREEAGRPTVEPVHYQGSGDLRALSRANSLAYFPAGERTYQQGETISVFAMG